MLIVITSMLCNINNYVFDKFNGKIFLGVGFQNNYVLVGVVTATWGWGNPIQYLATKNTLDERHLQ